MPSTIHLGSTGNDVERLQRILARSVVLGLIGPIDGVFSAAMDLWVRDFQATNGLVVDGVVGPVTWGHLPSFREASPRLASGSHGPAVGKLQQVLAGSAVAPDWAPYAGPIDGLFGAGTEAAVRSFQSSRGITVDGIVGDQTWFTLLTPGTMQHLTLEAGAGLVDGLPAAL